MNCYRGSLKLIKIDFKIDVLPDWIQSGNKGYYKKKLINFKYHEGLVGISKRLQAEFNLRSATCPTLILYPNMEIPGDEYVANMDS